MDLSKLLSLLIIAKKELPNNHDVSSLFQGQAKIVTSITEIKSIIKWQSNQACYVNRVFFDRIPRTSCTQLITNLF